MPDDAPPPAALTLLLAALHQMEDPAAERAAAELRELAGEATNTWQALALDVAAQAVQQHGPEGLHIALVQISQLADGKISQLDVADARTSHAILTAMERDEIGGRRAVRAWFTKLGIVLSALGAAFLTGVVSGSLGGLKS